MEDNDKTNVERNYLSPMIEVINSLKEKGVTKEYKVKDGKLEEMNGNHSYNPEELRIADEYRFEGTSDPDYMGILYVLETNSGDKGYISNAYGLYSDAEVDDFMKSIEKLNKEKARKEISDKKGDSV